MDSRGELARDKHGTPCKISGYKDESEEQERASLDGKFGNGSQILALRSSPKARVRRAGAKVGTLKFRGEIRAGQAGAPAGTAAGITLGIVRTGGVTRHPLSGTRKKGNCRKRDKRKKA